ncbi:MAG: hypothetical protein ABIS07_04820, partial [Dokdonella sp.]
RTPDGAGEAAGRVIAQTGLPALLVWWLARRRNPLWSWLQFGLAYLIAVIALGLLVTMGHARAEEPLPFEVPCAQAWTFVGALPRHSQVDRNAAGACAAISRIRERAGSSAIRLASFDADFRDELMSRRHRQPVAGFSPSPLQVSDE